MHKFNYQDEVKHALAEQRPVLALESTIISHGMPYPQNVELALELEALARSMKVVPATLAVINGEICIGLSQSQIEELGQAQNVRKLSRADIADCVMKGETGATTVAATMILAQKAGIEVFSTGGIGGVHKKAESSFDISADLHELSQTRMVVVCAGAKAILDLPKTYEVLETLGVPVYSFGSDQIPAFYSRDSGIQSPLRADHPGEIVESYFNQVALNLSASILVNNPIPKEDEIASREILPIIERALSESMRQNIQTKMVTPFLLQRVFELTQGRSLNANIALIRNNVELGSNIALELSAKRAK